MMKKNKISDLVFDDKNFNKGSEKGSALMNKSLNKFGAGRSVLIDKNNRLIAGNKTTEKFSESGGENVIIVDTDRNTLVAVRRKDNVTAKENIVWDADVLEAEIEEVKLTEWGFEEVEGTEKEEAPLKWVPDCLFPSNNPYDIPTLKMHEKPVYVDLPLRPWGADKRTKTGIGTYHFYVDDYRFEAIWDDPSKLIQSGCKNIIEPNLSLYETTPLSYGIFLIYKKRWIARFLQDYNVNVFADLNVTEKFASYNLLGIPEGYNAFFTRGYDNRIKALGSELQLAKEISGRDNPNLVIYGGSKKVKEFANKNNLSFINNTTLDL